MDIQQPLCLALLDIWPAQLTVMARYDPLEEYLRLRRGDNVGLAFAEIEKIIAHPLPRSARLWDWWWADEDVATTRHTQSKAWTRQGFTTVVNRQNETVEFRRKATR